MNKLPTRLSFKTQMQDWVIFPYKIPENKLSIIPDNFSFATGSTYKFRNYSRLGKIIIHNFVKFVLIENNKNDYFYWDASKQTTGISIDRQTAKIQEILFAISKNFQPVVSIGILSSFLLDGKPMDTTGHMPLTVWESHIS